MPQGNGFYVMQRGWTEHPMFGHQPLCRQAAWIWLIEHAAWKDHQENVRGKIITLRRGQVVASQRYLAKAWKWKRAKVERFLCVLRTEAAIETATEAGESIVTIHNYSKYQLVPNATEPRSEPLNEPPASQYRASTEPKENKGNTPFPKGKGAADSPAEKVRVDPTGVIFNECLSYLMAHGIKEPQGRSLLGSWRRDYGVGATIEIVSDASEKSVSEPVAWITAALKKRHDLPGADVGPI